MNNFDKKTAIFDLDGTLAVWNPITPETEEDILTAVDRILYSPKYYRNLKPYPLMVDFVKRLYTLLDGRIYIASCYLPDKGESTPYMDKREWVKEYLPFIPEENIILIPDGVNKSEWVANHLKREINKNDILFDDYHKNLTEWKEAGGFPVKVLNKVNSTYSLPGIYRISAHESVFKNLNDLSDVLYLQDLTPTPLETLYSQVMYKVLQDDLNKDYSFDLEREELNELFTNTLLPTLLENGGTKVTVSDSLWGVKYKSMTYFPLTDIGIRMGLTDANNELIVRSVFAVSPCENIEYPPKPVSLPDNVYHQFKEIEKKIIRGLEDCNVIAAPETPQNTVKNEESSLSLMSDFELTE